jgi:protein SCO1/2
MASRHVRSGLIIKFAAALAVAAFARAAMAGFTSAQLETVSASPPPSATLPLHLGFRDENGQPVTLAAAVGGLPAIVIFADYTCHTLCGPIVDFVVAGLAKTNLTPGAEYRLVVIGLDPKDGLETARAMRRAHIDPTDPIGRAAVFLSGDDADIRTTTQAVGLHYAYDAEHDQYAHPVAAYIVSTDGRVRRVLSALGLNGEDLRLAIIDTGNSFVGTFADRIHLLCYGYDPVRGIYTERITTALKLGAGATLIVLIGGIFSMAARQRRRSA